MLAALLTCALLAQDPLVLADEHARCVRTERMTALYAALAAVDAEQRTAACALVLARRPAGAGVAAGLGLRDIAQLTREVEGRPWTDLQALADSLEISLRPGIFEARGADAGPPEAAGEAITVRVHALWGADDAPDFTLALTWISPTGERIAARREPVDADYVPGAGFEMYVRPPASQPGTWLLEPCVELAGESACGVPTRVACIADFGARFAAALARAPAATDPDYPLLRMLDRLVRYGARGSVALDSAEMLDLLEGTAPALTPRPHLAAFVDRRGVDRWVWSLRPPGELELALCFVASEKATIDELFAGAVGARWAAFAQQQHALLLVTRLPAGHSAGEVRELLALLAADARSSGAESLAFFVVARAETAGGLQLALEGTGTYPFDGIVISSVVRRARAATVFPGVPRLLVSPGAVADEAAGLDVAPGAELAMFNELDLPGLVAAWLNP